ncbi:GNAT family N-acetyltransferase [Mycetocola zhujimingii]|uniref:GNAT family N-acetyltransferase n=1 Tax=Mycetocola zhujimingii TaxID=2079792 RepID=A0A2U1TCR9_9MICO|nr:GNAT family N-acetyltransferase [Mycetocola zhujimingii]PWC06697.1 GNAT family N-acetyltransferase [Mycetocola zhujimingii]
MEDDPGIRVISAADAAWHDVQAVFGTRGDPSSCWCQYFKMDNAEWKTASRETCEPLLERQVQELDTPPGLIAYLGSEPVGWCAVEPRTNYPRLSRGKVVQASTEPTDDPTVWAVTCFVVRVGFRKRGIATALLAAAAGHARAHGARVLEGYPVDPVARDKVSSADLYYGVVSQFAANGFTEVARPTPSRALMRLELAT